MSATTLKPLDRFLLTVVRYGLYAVLLLPFVVVLSYLYPWVSGKIWGLEIIVEILFPLWVWLALRRKEFRPAKNAFLYAVLAYFAVITLSAVLGDMPHRSFWSKPDRLTGLFFEYHLLAFFLMAAGVWRDRVHHPIMFSVAAATAMALYGIGQLYLGVGGSADTTRASGTLGNPSYLGQYLVPHFFFSLWLWWRDRHSTRRALWLATGLIILFGTYTAKSRGALLGLAVSAFVAMIIIAVKAPGKPRTWALVGIAAIVLGVAGFLLADRYWRPFKVWAYENRLSMQYLQETSKSRVLLLENAVKGFQARPLLGWGPENFESAYYFFYDPVTLRYSDYETRQDRPHNLILEMLSEVGLLGFLAYATMLWLGWRGVLKAGGKDRRFEAGALILASVSHLATTMFIFETPASYMMFFFQLALLAGFMSPKAETGTDELEQGSLGVAAVAAALCLWALWYGVIGTIKAARITADLIISFQNPIPAADFKTQAEQLMATKTPYLERDVRAVVSHLSMARGDYLTGDYLPVLKEMAAWEEQLAPKQQHDFVNALVTVSAYLSWWPRTPDEQAAVEESLARIKRLAPNRQEVWWVDAQVLMEKGDGAGAQADFEKALALDPGSTTAQGQYAGFLIRAGKIDDAMAFLEPRWAAVEADPDAFTAVNKAVAKVFDQQRSDDLVAIYEDATKHGLHSFEWSVAGALGNIGKGRLDEAQRIVDELKAQYPDKASLVDQYLTPELEAAKKQAAGGVPAAAPAPAPAPAH